MRYTWLTAVILISAVACDDSPTTVSSPPGVACGPSLIDLQWQNPYPQSNDLRSVWGFGPAEIYAVGDRGVIIRYDGATWTPMVSPTRENLHCLWGPTADSLYAVGSGGVLLRYDGSVWRMLSTNTTEILYSVWGSSGDHLFVVGANGLIREQDHGTWRNHDATIGDTRLRAVWGYSNQEVYAAGARATLLRFDGSQWNPIIVPQHSNEFRALWGPGSGYMYAVFETGVIHKYVNDTRVEWYTAGTTDAFGIWGFSVDDYVISSSSANYHHSAQGVTQFNIQNREPLYDIWGTEPNNLFCVGRSGKIVHFDGTGWSHVNRTPRSTLRDVWVDPVGQGAIAVGHNGAVLHQTGVTWTSEPVDKRYELHGVFGTAASDVFAVGRYAPDLFNWEEAILHYDGSTWTDMSTGRSNVLYDVWATSSNDAHAVGWAGLILRYDGSAWARVDSGGATWLSGIHGRSATDIYAVGTSGTVPEGIVSHFDGVSWTTEIVHGVERLYDVWCGNNIVVAVADHGQIAQRNGGAWSVLQTNTLAELFAVWGESDNEIYAVGWNGQMVVFDGQQWCARKSNTERHLYGAAGVGAVTLFVGENGTVLGSTGN